MNKPIGAIVVLKYALGVWPLRLNVQFNEEGHDIEYLFKVGELAILLSSVSDGWKDPSQMIMCLTKKRIAWSENDLVTVHE